MFVMKKTFIAFNLSFVRGFGLVYNPKCGEEALCLKMCCVYFLLNAALAFENVLMKKALVWIHLVKI